MSPAEIASVVLLTPLVICDLRCHSVPNPLILGLAVLLGLGAHVFGLFPWSWAGMAAALLLGIVADVPGGDLKALLLLGATIGYPDILPIIGGTYVATLVAWLFETYEWPWIPLLAANFIGYVLLPRVI
jgi:hypothetical protein